MTTPDCLDHLAALSERQDLVIGAGTVLSPADVDAAAGAGGRLIVSPNTDPDVIAEWAV